MDRILSKSILSSLKEDPWFGTKYSMNIYRGCQHACIYCDSRSSCYQLGELSHIRVKENALELLNKELRSKRVRGTIGTGSMNDPYMPVERNERIIREALKIIAHHKFPVHIITKSDLVLRDMDVIKEISRIYAAVSITITTADDTLSKIIEPVSPASSFRFNAISSLSANGIYTGITLMPLLPFINDTVKELKLLLEKAIEAKPGYIMPAFALTLREGSREYYYKMLDKHFPGMKERYIREFGNSHNCVSPNAKALYETFYKITKAAGIHDRMRHYQPDETEQLSLF